MPNDPTPSASHTPSAATAHASSNLSPQTLRQRNRHLFNLKRTHFLTDLILTLDVLIYAELSALYYHDISFLRLLLRSLLQFTFLTPKPAMLPAPPPHPPSRPIALILFSNLFCAAWHAYFPPPEAGEATRGYLHGGLAMDFVGQKGPANRAHLVLLDLVVMGLQVLCLGAVDAKRRAKEGSGTGSGIADATGAEGATVARAVNTQGLQTLEFEERGELASENREGDVELREMNRRGEREEEVEDERREERARLLATESEAPPRETDAHIFDAFNSGEIVVADLCMSRIVRQQFQQNREARAAATGVSTDVEAGAGAGGGGLSSRFTGNGFGWRMRIGGRIVGV
ncbi:hypothetical protein B9Z65_4246 [Elsinoe australis]|uniref:DUF1746 domain-containing protein n=1 Tax=Elsinoe australis TaxID=40998 RepID=A0A2P7Z285_9PEZI|nr:hypothetical protein B9Z65_4246 [Elsinoe australis]